MSPRTKLASVAALAALAVAGVGSLAFRSAPGDGATARSSSPASPGTVGRGAHGPVPYAQPVQLTQGLFTTAAATPDGIARGQAASAADSRLPRFRGWMNGVFIYPDGSGGPPASAGSIPPCTKDAPATTVQEQQLHSFEHHIPVPSWLPEGAWAYAGEWGGGCGDRIDVVERRIELLPAGTQIVIVRQFGLKAVMSDVSDRRVAAGTIDGKRAAFIVPVSSDGYGNAEIIIDEPFGLTRIRAIDVSFHILRRIAENL